MGKAADEMRKAELEIELASLRSHELHMRHIYGVRYAGLAVAAAAILAGAWMIFEGLSGTFDWAVEAPKTISSKLTNASPGIGFAVVGMIIAFIVILQKPVSYKTGGGPESINTARARYALHAEDYRGRYGVELGAPDARRPSRAASITGDRE